jgi:hypothetical protein
VLGVLDMLYYGTTAADGGSGQEQVRSAPQRPDGPGGGVERPGALGQSHRKIDNFQLR